MRGYRSAMRILPAGRPVAGLAILSILLGACSAGAGGTAGAGGVASQAPGAATGSAAPGSSSAATYPGWPGNGSAIGSADIVPILVSSDIAVGRNRFLVSLADAQNNLLAAPDLAVHLRFFDLAKDPARPAFEADAPFIWAIPGQRGLYDAPVTFPSAGDWGVEVAASRAGEAPKTVRVTFQVRQTSATPAIGAPAPPSDNATLGPGIDIATISTDPQPDPDFYQMTVRQAIAAGKPFVVVFATPKFCTSQMCGPTLNNVKAVSAGFKGRVNFIHIEVYTNLSDPAHLQLVPAVQQWGLPSEPWVFVVDAHGRVADKFEGICPPDELRASLQAALQG